MIDDGRWTIVDEGKSHHSHRSPSSDNFRIALALWLAPMHVNRASDSPTEAGSRQVRRSWQAQERVLAVAEKLRYVRRNPSAASSA